MTGSSIVFYLLDSKVCIFWLLFLYLGVVWFGVFDWLGSFGC